MMWSLLILTILIMFVYLGANNASRNRSLLPKSYLHSFSASFLPVNLLLMLLVQTFDNRSLTF